MGNVILGNRARTAILARTFVDADCEFYLRELVRLVGMAPRTIQLEVERLVETDLLSERRSGNRRYLRANQSHPLFGPVREIVLKTDGLAHVLRGALNGLNIDFALVYGSMASRAPSAGSDVDVLVVGDVGLRETVAHLAEAQDTLGREITPNVWTLAEFDRRVEHRDSFLARVLDGPTIAIVGDVPEVRA